MAKRKILITSVGSLVGWALLKSLANHRDRYTIIGTNSTPESPNLYICDKLYLVPETGDGEKYGAKLSEILQSEYPRVVIPGRDAELKYLADFSTDSRFKKIAFLATTPNLVKIFNDKYETFLFARRHKLPFAKSAFSQEDVEQLVNDFGFPLVAKPRWDGHASKDTWLVTDWKAAHQLLKTGRHLFQEVIAVGTIGEQRTQVIDRAIPWRFEIEDVRHAAEMIMGHSGEVVSLSMVISDTAGALSQNMSVIEDGNMQDIVKKYATALGRQGHRGVLNLQGKRDPDKGFIPFELNARFTGSCAARTLLGYNQVLHAISHFLDDEGPWSDHEPGSSVKIYRTPIYQSVKREHVNELATKNLWQRS